MNAVRPNDCWTIIHYILEDLYYFSGFIIAAGVVFAIFEFLLNKHKYRIDITNQNTKLKNDFEIILKKWNDVKTAIQKYLDTSKGTTTFTFIQYPKEVYEDISKKKLKKNLGDFFNEDIREKIKGIMSNLEEIAERAFVLKLMKKKYSDIYELSEYQNLYSNLYPFLDNESKVTELFVSLYDKEQSELRKKAHKK